MQGARIGQIDQCVTIVRSCLKDYLTRVLQLALSNATDGSTVKTAQILESLRLEELERTGETVMFDDLFGEQDGPLPAHVDDDVIDLGQE